MSTRPQPPAPPQLPGAHSEIQAPRRTPKTPYPAPGPASPPRHTCARPVHPLRTWLVPLAVGSWHDRPLHNMQSSAQTRFCSAVTSDVTAARGLSEPRDGREPGPRWPPPHRPAPHPEAPRRLRRSRHLDSHIFDHFPALESELGGNRALACLVPFGWLESE